MNYSNIKCHFYNCDFDSFLETGTLCHKTKISSDISWGIHNQIMCVFMSNTAVEYRISLVQG